MELENLHGLIVERNARETDQFLHVHKANATLMNQIDALQRKCEALEREQVVVSELSSNGSSAALRNETRLRDKLEKLQEDLNKQLTDHQNDTAKALETAKSLALMKESNSNLEQRIKKLEHDVSSKDKAISHLEEKYNDAKATTKLAEKQYTGLKETIRSLQEENDVFKEENGKLIDRLVNDKEKTSTEVNVLNEMIDQLKKEVDMLRTLKHQDEKRRSWFGKSSDVSNKDDKPYEGKTSSYRFGTTGSIIPTSVKHTINAHAGDATCVCYSKERDDLLVTSGSSDSVVKVWNTTTATLQATLRGGGVITACDISGSLVVGGGSDKMCRIWDLQTQRMIHQLVGHGNKITCVKIFGSERAVLTGSADRSIKVWDISRKTYRQTTTLRHSSTCYTVDVASDSFTTVSGHIDGGLRFWDVRTGERTGNLEDLHKGGVTCVKFHPVDATQILTNGKDSSLKVLDMRTRAVLYTLRHDDFRTIYNWSACSISPDGQYAASFSGSNGNLFVWSLKDGKLLKKIDSQSSGGGGISWGSGGSNGQQVATLDREGKLCLWV